MPESEARRMFGSWPRTARWAAYVVVAVVLAVVAGLVMAVLTVRQSFPSVSGEIAVPGLTAQVEVLRDESGIPQVYADTAQDLFYAQGFVQAQDRFFEMDFRRHVTSGRLSELLGRDALETDMLIRTMGWRRIAERELSLLRPDTLRYLDAYSAGVNAYIGSRESEELSLEYSLLALDGLDYRPEEWTPADSVSWLKAMAWDLRSNMTEEIERSLASASSSASEVASLYPAYPYGRHRPVAEQGGVVGGVFQGPSDTGRPPASTGRVPASEDLVAAYERLGARLDAVPVLVGRGSGLGSNSWVVDGEHSTTGEPILANDPHLDISVPGIWHQMGLHCRQIGPACPFDVTGFTFAGLPGVVIGHNREIAWGFTNLAPDVADLYLERVRAGRYLYDGRRRPLRTRMESVDVAGEGDSVDFVVRSTRHGPLLSDVSPELEAVGAHPRVPGPARSGRDGFEVSLSWTALSPNRTADAIFMLDEASSWEDFRAAARRFAAPAQNLVYADREGHIGYQASGLVPIRRPGHGGDYPVAGWEPDNDWTGRFVGFDALPSVLDPEEGVIVSANQAVAGRDYPRYLTDSWAYGYRSDRILDLLENRMRLGVEDMTEIQLDDRNGFAPTFVPYLLDILLPSPYLSAGQRRLQDWRFRQTKDSSAAAYYNAVWRQTLALTFHDQLPRSVWPDGGDRWFEVMRGLLADPGSSWWDDVDTETVVETRDEILFTALAQARDELVALQARRPTEWTWGHHHQMNLENQSLGQSEIGVVGWLLNRARYEVAGGGDLVNATKWNAASGDYTVTAAPSMRMVVSLADLDDSRWINLTGVSGHAFDEHYVDQTDLWVRGETLPWRFSRREVAAGAEDRLILVPTAGGPPPRR